MGFKKVSGNRMDHDEEWVRAESYGSLQLSRAVAERWFEGVDRVLFLVDEDTNRVVVMPETNSADDADLRKITRSSSGYIAVSFGAVCNEFGFSAQDIEDPVVMDAVPNEQYGGPMFDMTPLVEEYAA